ncbi:MAG: ferritin-like domain-containing protein [Chloroflexi bacterium]|nr:ferritin-like domain-containing protein [Chloroflexota bacterium]
MSDENAIHRTRALELLGQILQVEYRFIIHYPRLMDMAPDEETREMMRVVGESSVRHADVTAQVLRTLGAVPPFPAFEALPADPPKRIFERQLEYEKLALMLHSEAAGLVEEWRPILQSIADEERSHIRIVERILEQLGKI